MLARALCLLVGYLLGSLLAADGVMRWRTGRSAFAVGSGNPGMANVGAVLGARWAAVALAGDVGKTIVAVALAWAACAVMPGGEGLRQAVLTCPDGIAFPWSGSLAAAYAGLGAVAGHDFSAFQGLRGGKGVAAGCAALVLFCPVWGGAACLVGLALVALTHRLDAASLVIVLVFLIEMAVCAAPTEVMAFAGALVALAAVTIARHARATARRAR